MFTCSSNEPNSLTMQRAVGAPSETINIVKREYHDKVWAQHIHDEIKDWKLEGPGLKDIKWETLYDGYRKFIPHEKRVTFMPYCIDPGPHRRQQVKANVEEAQKNRQERSSTAKVTKKMDTAANKKRKPAGSKGSSSKKAK